MANQVDQLNDQAREALRVSESRYRRLFETARDGILLLNAQTAQIEDVNPYLIEMLGYTHAEFLGKKLWEVGAFADMAQSKEMFAVLQEVGFVRYENLPLKTRSGERIAVEFVCNSYDCEGVKVIQCNVRDITQRKQEEALRISLEEQLRESQKMEAIGTLAGGIAHDFNNIIATILGNADLALEDVRTNISAQQSIEEILKAGRRARDLVQQILSFSRRQPMLRKPMVLGPVIGESVRLMRATFPAQVEIAVSCETPMPEVLADATQIEQVLLNLATNAMQAACGGPQRIEIRLDTVILDTPLASEPTALRAMHSTRPAKVVRLTLSDDGPGMDATTIAHIFEPFFTTKALGEGTGLGLSVVRGIVHAHEGAIMVSSQPGLGSTFSVYLPIVGAMAVQAIGSTKETVVKAAATQGGGRRLLYVDDDASIVFMVTRLLERRGYVVSGFTDAREAILGLHADPSRFDLVVTDYNMPYLSGLDVARKVRDIRADLPVAIVSGFIDERLLSQARGAGVAELIVKASNTSEFSDAIHRLATSVAPPLPL